MTLLLLFSLPVLVALILWLWHPPLAWSRRISLLTSAVLMIAAVVLLRDTAKGHVEVVAFGGWRPPYGIAFAADSLSALFVALQAGLLGIVVLALRPELHGALTVRRAHPLALMLTSGLIGGFLTGDLFNLFVMFEAVLISSYLLLQVPGTRRSVAGALPVIVINFVASGLFLAALGLLYGMVGSVNIADLAEHLGDAPIGLRRVALALLVVAFATKAALVPLCFWMPASYPTLAAPLAALFAGIMTKLGVYALLRIHPLLSLDASLQEALVWAGGLSALLGVLAALSQYEVRRLLSFHSVSQVGYIVAALGLGGSLGLAAALFFALHHSLVKPSLYLVADELERRNSTRDLREMDFRKAGGGLLALGFGIAAFSLAGLPPLSGFFGKLSVFRAAFEAEAFPLLILLVLASLFTLASMLKIWRFAFSQKPVPAEPVEFVSQPMGGALGLLVALILILGFAAGPVYTYALAAAEETIDGSQYQRAVLDASGLGPEREF
jgi:multicomponent Na+:H+ antiporter subunit D